MNRTLLADQSIAFRLRFLVVFVCIALQACAPTNRTDEQFTGMSGQLSEQQSQISSLEKEVSKLSSSLTSQYESICSAQQAKKDKTLKARGRQIKSLESELKSIRRVCDSDQSAPIQFENKLVLGEIENVLLVDQQLTLSARVDTGAETSSLGVYNQRLFERDGRQWVRFSLSDDKKAKLYEYRVRGRVRIKQSAILEGEERIEIRMAIKIGDKSYKRQIFNLSDRSFLDHQLLIGRSFLTDTAVVDASVKYLLGR